MRIWNHFTQSERRVLGAIVVVSLVASGVSAVRKAHPEWFLGEPTFVAEPKPPLTPADEDEAPPEPATAQTPLAAPAPERPVSGAPPAAKPALDAAQPIPLNSADAEALELLPGVGPVLAERIIAYRREIGGFRAVDDLLDVKGIGAKTLAKIRPLVVVSP